MALEERLKHAQHAIYVKNSYHCNSTCVAGPFLTPFYPGNNKVSLKGYMNTCC